LSIKLTRGRLQSWVDWVKCDVECDVGVYDLFGNVWEWTSTVYAPVGQLRDRNRPKYTAKGGSFLDTNVSISSR